MKLSPGLAEARVECDACLLVEVYVAPPEQLDQLVDDDGWMRNKATDRDLCPTCAEARVGFYGVSRMLL